MKPFGYMWQGTYRGGSRAAPTASRETWIPGVRQVERITCGSCMTGYLLGLILLASPGVGGSWRWQNPRPQGNPLYAVVFADARRGIAVGRDAAILRTTDGGQSWQVVRSSIATPLYGLAIKGRRAWAVGARGL